MKPWRMERLILLGMTVLGGLAGTVCAANPTERRWNVAEGFVNAATSWQNGTLPAQGTSEKAGEMAYFTGAGDKTVRFPAGGWTDCGVFYFAKGLADGTTLTFDATGTSWTFAPGTYFSNWQILTLCGDNHSGISYPHILQVTANAGGKVAEPIFTLTDGVVRFFKHTAQGNVLALERGTWDFTRTGASGTDYLLFFNAEWGGTDEVVLRAGTSLKTPEVRLNPNAGLAGARFRVEGGAHALGTVVVGGAKETSTTPVLFEMTAGTVAAGAVNVGNRTTTSDNRLALRGTAALTTEALTLSESGAGATVDLADRATLAVTKDLLFRPAVEGTVATLVATNDAVVTVAGFVRPNYRAESAARSELVLGGRARLRTTGLAAAASPSARCRANTATRWRGSSSRTTPWWRRPRARPSDRSRRRRTSSRCAETARLSTHLRTAASSSGARAAGVATSSCATTERCASRGRSPSPET